ncbi:MAG: RluA family pseudouridine synthase [Planctomycetes bacterium]|nr:RluA family pseudouridine synthase [Planctomycetota bacterium]
MPRRLKKKKRQGQRDLSQEFQEWTFEVGADEHGNRLDKFLHQRIRWRSRQGIQNLVAEEGAVQVVPGKDPQQATIGLLRVSLRLRTGQFVMVRQPNPKPPPDAPIGPDPSNLEVVYEDPWLLAVNKPPHISVHPSHGHLTGSLIHLIHERHRAVWGETEDMPTLCHRLDRETSGVLLTAKTQFSRTQVGMQFEAREINKTYQALVVGEMQQESGVIELPIGRALNSSVRLRMGVREDGEGSASKTVWQVLDRAPGHTLVKLEPHTGRTHQLRVHMEALGHPIVGDKLYLGGDDVFVRSVEHGLTDLDREFLQMDRQALHNWKLEISHPESGEATLLEAPLYHDIADFLAALKADS